MKCCNNYGYEYNPPFCRIYNKSMIHILGKYYRLRRESNKNHIPCKIPYYTYLRRHKCTLIRIGEGDLVDPNSLNESISDMKGKIKTIFDTSLFALIVLCP
jgi:hypothetical protein